MAKKTNIAITDDSLQNNLASVLAESLNKKFKDSHKVAHFLDGESDSPSEIKEWISTGSTMVDLAISNRPYGGIPVGRITEITGLEASGKSLLASHCLADTQKKGGIAVYIDTENAASTEFLKAIGVNLKEMLYLPLDTVEDIFVAIEEIIEKVRSSNKSRLVTIVVDSLAAASTKQEMASDFDKDGWATAKALILSKALRKITTMIGRERICLIFTNQLRTRMNATFGDPYTTSGGKSVPYHSSVRLRLQSIGQIKLKVDGRDEILGTQTRLTVKKNRCGPPLRVVDYDIYFDSGIDDYGAWLQIMKAYGIVTNAGAWYTYDSQKTGESIKFLSKDFREKLESNPDLKTEIYERICDEYIMKYSSKDFGIDDIDIDTDVQLEEN